MKFIHTGDLHLDSPFKGLSNDFPQQLWEQVHQSTFVAWQKIVDLAIDERVDFVVVVGDIFDREHHDVAAEDFFVRQCQRLAGAQIPLYLSYGNHDYQNVATDSMMLPQNVHVFDNRVETKTLQLSDHRTVALTGFSYGSRWISDDLASQYPDHGTVDFHIGLLHGAVSSANDNNYAPFTLTELLAKKYDYWALGHIHKHQLLNEKPPIVYCGDPQGRHINEDGDHGCYLVEEEAGQLVSHFQKMATILWQTVSISLPAETTLADARVAVEDQVRQQTNEETLTLVNLELVSKSEQPLDTDRLLAYLQQDCQRQARIRWWPLAISNKQTPAIPEIAEDDRQYWEAAVDQTFTLDQLQAVIKDEKLDRYGFVVDQVDEHFLDQIKLQAMQLLGQKGDNDEDSAD